jgi:hypothetical protein
MMSVVPIPGAETFAASGEVPVSQEVIPRLNEVLTVRLVSVTVVAVRVPALNVDELRVVTYPVGTESRVK